MTVAEHLAASRQAHESYRLAAGKLTPEGDVAEAPHPTRKKAALALAAHHRQQAQQLDPTRSDPAWDEDRKINRGISSEELLAFYVGQR